MCQRTAGNRRHLENDQHTYHADLSTSVEGHCVYTHDGVVCHGMLGWGAVGGEGEGEIVIVCVGGGM